MASAAVCYKIVALLLFIHCLFLLLLFVCVFLCFVVCVRSIFGFVVICVISGVAIISLGKRELITFVVLRHVAK